MSLKMSSTNTSPYSYFSEGDESAPLSASATLDNSGGTTDSNVITSYLVGTSYNYTGITVTFQNEETGINWQLSLDGTNWAESITPTDMNALASDQVTTVYAKFVANNDGTVSTGEYTIADIKITATENAS